jgi:aminoglycoside 6'-N-acetyltransferase I
MIARHEQYIQRCAAKDLDAWVALRLVLWPDEDRDDLCRNARELLARRDEAIAFLALADDEAIGFAEATLRREFVNGCSTSPVAFLEGLYVRQDYRRRGVARRLCMEIERWALDLGCTELGSDTYLHFLDSQQAHTALGFEEMERVICYRKRLRRPSTPN